MPPGRLHRPPRGPVPAVHPPRVESLWPISLHYKVEVVPPAIVQPIVGVALDLPSPRIPGAPGVTAFDPDVDVLDGDVPEPVIGRQLVQELVGRLLAGLERRRRMVGALFVDWLSLNLRMA